MSIEKVTLNEDQKLFVLSTGAGTSSLGFEVVFELALELAQRVMAKGLRVALPTRGEIGTLWQYAQYQTLLAQYSTINDDQTWFDGRTPIQVQKALEHLRLSGKKVRIFLGNTKTGRDWMEEFDTIGSIARSMGPMKVPLIGDGHAVLTHCIVKLVNTATGEVVYEHPKYHLPKIELVNAPDYEKSSGYTHSVMVEDADGDMQCQGNFKSSKAAQAWINFISGQTHKRPR